MQLPAENRQLRYYNVQHLTKVRKFIHGILPEAMVSCTEFIRYI